MRGGPVRSAAANADGSSPKDGQSIGFSISQNRYETEAAIGQTDNEIRSRPQMSAPYSRLSGSDVNSDHIQVVAGGFESFLSIMVRNKSGVIVKGHIAFPAQTIKDSQ